MSILCFATCSAAHLLPHQTSKFWGFFFLLGVAALGCREVAGVGLTTASLPTRGETMQQARVSCVPIHQNKMQPASASRTSL